MIFSIIKMKDEYLYLLKTLISLQIVIALSAPFLYLGEILENEIIYIILNLISSAVYVVYYIKMIKTKYELSIPRIIFYSVFPILTYFTLTFSLTKIEIFSSNISKLILYQ